MIAELVSGAKSNVDQPVPRHSTMGASLPVAVEATGASVAREDRDSPEVVEIELAESLVFLEQVAQAVPTDVACTLAFCTQTGLELQGLWRVVSIEQLDGGAAVSLRCLTGRCARRELWLAA